eukprot:scaffold38418_cov168-Amphora_coffeaeformis.AAC.2
MHRRKWPISSYPTSTYTIMKKSALSTQLVLICSLLTGSGAWTVTGPLPGARRGKVGVDVDGITTLHASSPRLSEQCEAPSSRRQLLSQGVGLVISAAVGGIALPAQAITRAVGSGEIACREAGNCLETGEWDGAVGWSWGGKDRCDPADPLCGPDGKLRDTPLQGQPVPKIDQGISHVAAIKISIGRDETDILRLGLYGDTYPEYVAQLLDFLSTSGLTTTVNTKGFSTDQVPVSLARGTGIGSVTNLLPSVAVVMGIPSQASAYAKYVGTTKVLDGFVPQPPPPPLYPPADKAPIPHDRAGLLSVPDQGLGYGGSGFEPNDEIFGDAFWVTDAALPSQLSKKRLVIGQVLDAASMAFLERLANLPTQRGLRGVLPGQNSGPPLKKVTVQKVEVATVVNRPESS